MRKAFIEVPISIRSLAEALGILPLTIVYHFEQRGLSANVFDILDPGLAKDIAKRYGCELVIAPRPRQMLATAELLRWLAKERNDAQAGYDDAVEESGVTLFDEESAKERKAYNEGSLDVLTRLEKLLSLPEEM